MIQVKKQKKNMNQLLDKEFLTKYLKKHRKKH